MTEYKRGDVGQPYISDERPPLAVRILTACVGVTAVMFMGALFAYSIVGGVW